MTKYDPYHKIESFDMGDEVLYYVKDSQHFWVLGPDMRYRRSDGTVYQYDIVDEGLPVLHCTTGPAIIWANGDQEFFLKGERYDIDAWLMTIDLSDEEKLMLKLQYG